MSLGMFMSSYATSALDKKLPAEGEPFKAHAVYSEDYDGHPQQLIGIWVEEADARNNAEGHGAMGSNVEPRPVTCIRVEGKCYLLEREEPIALNVNLIRSEVERVQEILSKMSPAERALLQKHWKGG